MRRSFSVLLALALAVPVALSAPAVDAQPPAPRTIRVDVVARDLIYDPVRDVLYASVHSSDSKYPNKVVTIDPQTAQVISSTTVGPTPGSLAMSDDGTALFVGIDALGMVKKVSLSNMTMLWSHTFAENGHGYLTAGDIAVMPGTNDTIAVSRRAGGNLAGVVIIDGGVARPVISPGHNAAHSIVFGDDGSELYGSDTEGGSVWEFVWHSVDASGVVAMDVADYGGGTLAFHGGRVYTSRGVVLDTGSNPPTPIHTGMGAVSGASVTVDIANNAVYFGVEHEHRTTPSHDPPSSATTWTPRTCSADGRCPAHSRTHSS